MSKATHRGTCQICHRAHKLPGGVVAKHGYTLSFGYFAGTCRGSGHLPAEVSCDLAREEAEKVKQHVAELRMQAEQLDQEPTDPIAWILRREYFGRRSVSIPTRVVVHREDNGQCYYVERYPNGVDRRWTSLVLGIGNTTPIKMAWHLNKMHARRVRADAAEAEAAAEMLADFVANWKLGELQAIR